MNIIVCHNKAELKLTISAVPITNDYYCLLNVYTTTCKYNLCS